MSEDCCDVPDAAGSTLARGANATVTIALTGNPNVGKTTLFNALTGSSAKVSNYPGITVERRVGALALPCGASELCDLPGTYSLNARSAEEQIALDALLGLHGARAPEVVVVCLDATQIVRSAYLLLQCRELGLRCVGAMTMVDEAGASVPDARKLADVLGCEIIPVTARTGRGLRDLNAAIDRAMRAERRATRVWQPSPQLRKLIDGVREALPESWRSTARYGRELREADDALALWALTCVDGGDDGDDSPTCRRVCAARSPPPRSSASARTKRSSRAGPGSIARSARSLIAAPTARAPSASIACCCIARSASPRSSA